MISKYLERLVRKDLVSYCRPALEGLACQADADVAGYIDKRFSDLSGIFLRYRKGKKPGLRPEVLARYRAELDEAGEWYRREAMDWYFSKKRQRDIALIEYPLLSHKIAVRMQKKGIPYLFATKGIENILTVQIVWEYFFEIPMNLENCDRVLDLMNYILMRPECASEEVPEIRHRKNYKLARSWKEVASGGSA